MEILLTLTLIRLNKLLNSLPAANDKGPITGCSLSEVNDVKSDFLKLPESVREFGLVVMPMAVDEEPNYTLLISIMKNLSGSQHLNDPYDWENDYREVLKEQKLVSFAR
ncbi:unnamed protein product [Gongylonema pulchrum]|uniref:Peptidase_M13_N domain-containing protein n=1 Tax=Gongylonema pulchrum TaxID=637853 RepID=A0A183D1P7_9BILA|nr:unnamed protein product [Gongylonema pulchrum]